MTSFLIIQHEDNCPADFFGQWWREAGVDLTIVHGKRDEIPAGLGEHAALVVLGGGMSCQSDDENPWLPATRSLIADTVRADRPFLGICLGFQLAAVGLGGQVVRKDVVSMGLTPIGLQSAAATDPLFEVVADGARAVQYNVDHVAVLPDGASVLAHAADGHVQAARFAERAWGVQFHPECSPATFDDWTVAKPDEKRPSTPGGVPLERLADEVRAADAELAATWRPLALRFRDLVA